MFGYNLWPHLKADGDPIKVNLTIPLRLGGLVHHKYRQAKGSCAKFNKPSQLIVSSSSYFLDLLMKFPSISFQNKAAAKDS